jgi:quercetin dioxygenase-like cupin family protein
MIMHEHRTAARISLQTLAGHIRLKLPGRTVELAAGQLLALDQCVPHDVEAEEDSAFLLTLSWPGEDTDTRKTG